MSNWFVSTQFCQAFSWLFWQISVPSVRSLLLNVLLWQMCIIQLIHLIFKCLIWTISLSLLNTFQVQYVAQVFYQKVWLLGLKTVCFLVFMPVKWRISSWGCYSDPITLLMLNRKVSDRDLLSYSNIEIFI